MQKKISKVNKTKTICFIKKNKNKNICFINQDLPGFEPTGRCLILDVLVKTI